MTLGQRVAVMKDGRLHQVAPPMDVYRRPANAFVGGFVGSPAMNFLSGTLAPADDGWLLEGAGFSVFLAADRDAAAVRRLEDRGDGPGAPVLLGVRPHDIELVEPGRGDARARVDVVEPLGSEILLHLDVEEREGEEEFRAVVPPESAARVDEAVGLRFRRDRLHLFDAGSGSRIG